MTEDKNQSRKTFRFGLLTFLLAVAAIAVWIPVYQSRVKGREIRQNLVNLKLAARDLNVIDENKFAASKKHLIDNNHHWRVYLPEAAGAQYRLRVANDDIPTRRGLAKTPLTKTEFPASTVSDFELTPGRHEIGLIVPYATIGSRFQRDATADVQLLLDDIEMANVSVPNSITIRLGRGFDELSHSIQRAASEPLVLTRSTDRLSSAERDRGLMMWIERVDPGNTK